MQIRDLGNLVFNLPDMVIIEVPADGSCFFHAILLAIYRPYRLGYDNGYPINRSATARSLRDDLAKRLQEHHIIDDETTPLVYDTLSKGTLRENAKTLPQYTLESMQAELRSNSSVDFIYLEFISNELNKDIYIINLDTKDVYIMTDIDIMYKNRDSIILAYSDNHFELIGVRTNNGDIDTLFAYNDVIITSIRQRIQRVKLPDTEKEG